MPQYAPKFPTTGKGKQTFKGKGKGAYEIHAHECDEHGEPDHLETFGAAQDEGPFAELGGGEIGHVDVPWSVVVRRSRKPTDMRPMKLSPSKQACVQQKCESVNQVPRWQLCRNIAPGSNSIGSVDINVVHENSPKNDHPDWERIPMKIDSGAIDTVIPKSAALSVKMVHTEASRGGRGFRAANGTPIDHFGQKAIAGWGGRIQAHQHHCTGR